MSEGIKAKVYGFRHPANDQVLVLSDERQKGAPRPAKRGATKKFRRGSEEKDYTRYVQALKKDHVADIGIEVRREGGGAPLYFEGAEAFAPNCFTCGLLGDNEVEARPFVPALDVYMTGAEPHYAYVVPELLSLGEGYVYLFKGGRLWRELAVDGKNKMRDIDVAAYRAMPGGDTFTPAACEDVDPRDKRKPAGVPLEEIWIVGDAGGYRIFFAQQQVSWARIAWYEKNGNELMMRSQALVLGDIARVPECCPREVDKEFVHARPEKVGRDATGSVLKEALEKAEQERPLYWNNTMGPLEDQAEWMRLPGVGGMRAALPYMFLKLQFSHHMALYRGPTLGAANLAVEWDILSKKSAAAGGAPGTPSGAESPAQSIAEEAKALRELFTSPRQDTTRLFTEAQKSRKIFAAPVYDPLYTASLVARQARHWGQLGAVCAHNCNAEANPLLESASLLYGALCLEDHKLRDRLDGAKMRAVLKLVPRVAAQSVAQRIRTGLSGLLRRPLYKSAFFELAAANGGAVLTGFNLWGEFLETLDCSLKEDPLLGFAEAALHKDPLFSGLDKRVADALNAAFADAEAFPLDRPLPPAEEMAPAVNDGSGKNRFTLLHKLGSTGESLPYEQDLSPDLAAVSAWLASETNYSDILKKSTSLLRKVLQGYFKAEMKSVLHALEAVKDGKVPGGLALWSAKAINTGRAGLVTKDFSFKKGKLNFTNPRNRTGETSLALLPLDSVALRHLESTAQNKNANKKVVSLRYKDAPKGENLRLTLQPSGSGDRRFAAVSPGSEAGKLIQTLADEKTLSAAKGQLRLHLFFSGVFFPIQAMNIIQAVTDPSLKNTIGAAGALADMVQGLNNLRGLVRISEHRIAASLRPFITKSGGLMRVCNLSATTLTRIGLAGNVLGLAGYVLSARSEEQQDNNEAALAYYWAAGFTGGVIAAGAAGTFLTWLGFAGAASWCPPAAIVLGVLAVGAGLYAAFLHEDNTEIRRCIMHGPLGKEDVYSPLGSPDMFRYFLLSALYPVFIDCAFLSEVYKYKEADQAKGMFAVGADEQDTFRTKAGENPLIISVYSPLIATGAVKDTEVYLHVREHKETEVSIVVPMGDPSPIPPPPIKKPTVTEEREAFFLHEKPGTGLLRFVVKTRHKADSSETEWGWLGNATTSIRQTFSVYLRFAQSYWDITGIPAPSLLNGPPVPLAMGRAYWYAYQSTDGQLARELRGTPWFIDPVDKDASSRLALAPISPPSIA